jgi:hypothetical protein
MRYRTMEELLDFVDRPANRKLSEIYTKYRSQMYTAQGSQHNHQAWDGGYIDHVTDTMNIARLLFVTMNDKRKLEFTLSDALIVLFFHDIEKAFPSDITKHVDAGCARPKAKNKVRYCFLHEHKVWDLLSNDQKNAIDHAEGEGSSYTNEHRAMGPLAAFCHICDVTSARIWFDRPLSDSESWGWRESGAIGDHQLWGV